MCSSIIFTFLLLVVLNETSAVGFTYQEYLDFQGYDFCEKENSAYFKEVCINAAIKLKIIKYDQNALNKLSCSKDKSLNCVQSWFIDEETVTIVYPSVVQCTYKEKGHETVKFLGKGKNKNDVFVYTSNNDATLIPENNLENVLIGA